MTAAHPNYLVIDETKKTRWRAKNIIKICLLDLGSKKHLEILLSSLVLNNNITHTKLNIKMYILKDFKKYIHFFYFHMYNINVN